MVTGPGAGGEGSAPGRTSARAATRLREAGIRATPARVAVLAAFLDAPHHHLTAEQVVETVAGVPVHRATVYRTLETLEARGILTHLHVGHGPLAYHLAPGPGHAHALCTGCGRIVHLPERAVTALVETVREDSGFRIDPSHVALVGRCPACGDPPAQGWGAAGTPT